MEFWISFNNNAEKLQLPVPPQEFSIQQGNINHGVNVENIGEVNIIGREKLAAITLTSFFPAQKYSFCTYDSFPNPYDCTAMIEKWRKSGKPVRLIITDTSINLPCAIENFSYGEKDGSGDIYYTLELKEYRFIKAETSDTGKKGSADTSNREAKESPKTHVVKAGDTLWAIAKSAYGDGSKWKTIADKNGVKDPKKLQVGKRLVL